MTQVVGADPLLVEVRAGFLRGGNMLGDQPLNGVGAESPCPAGREDGVVGSASALGQPEAQELGCGLVEWRVSPFASLAEALDVSAIKRSDRAGRLGNAGR